MKSKIVSIYTRGRRIKGILRLANKPEYHDIELSLPEIKLLLKEGHRIEEKYNDRNIILNIYNFDMEAKDIILLQEKNKITDNVKDSTEEIKKLRAEVITLTSEKDTIQKESDKTIKELNSQIADKNSTISTLNTKIAENTTTIDDLNKRIADLTKQIKA